MTKKPTRTENEPWPIEEGPAPGTNEEYEAIPDKEEPTPVKELRNETEKLLKRLKTLADAASDSVASEVRTGYSSMPSEKLIEGLAQNLNTSSYAHAFAYLAMLAENAVNLTGLYELVPRADLRKLVAAQVKLTELTTQHETLAKDAEVRRESLKRRDDFVDVVIRELCRTVLPLPPLPAAMNDAAHISNMKAHAQDMIRTLIERGERALKLEKELADALASNADLTDKLVALQDAKDDTAEIGAHILRERNEWQTIAQTLADAAKAQATK